MIDIYVGSTSIHKVGAVRNACRDLKILDKVNISSHEAKSLVSDQPYGLTETMQGATNRAVSVWLPKRIAIGIEGGLIDLPSSKITTPSSVKNEITFLCMAVVCLIEETGKMFYSTSAGMQFASKDVAEAQKRGITVGKVLSDKYGGDHTDPRAILSFGRANRQSSIEEAVKLALFNIF